MRVGLEEERKGRKLRRSHSFGAMETSEMSWVDAMIM